MPVTGAPLLEAAPGGMAGSRAYIAEYDAASKGCPPDASLLEEIARLERRIFPKHESLARSFEQELRKRHTGLIYAAEVVPAGGGERGRGEVIGYVMYSSVSSLCASITKLAGPVVSRSRNESTFTSTGEIPLHVMAMENEDLQDLGIAQDDYNPLYCDLPTFSYRRQADDDLEETTQRPVDTAIPSSSQPNPNIEDLSDSFDSMAEFIAFLGLDVDEHLLDYSNLLGQVTGSNVESESSNTSVASKDGELLFGIIVAAEGTRVIGSVLSFKGDALNPSVRVIEHSVMQICATTSAVLEDGEISSAPEEVPSNSCQ